MPKQPMDYTRTVIYKICCNDLSVTDVYVGHTTNFNQRKHAHRNCCINEKQHRHNSKVYQTIRANGGWDNWSMIQICEYPCNTFHEAALEERRHYEILNADLNMVNPCRKRKEYVKIYHQQNRERLIEKQKLYIQQNRSQISEKDKIRYQKNKDIISKKGKIYRDANKDKILEYRKRKYTCCCGSTLRIDGKKDHEKSTKHLQFIQNNNNPENNNSEIVN